jgi:hypothetical protein
LAPSSPESASISGKKLRAHQHGVAAFVAVHGNAEWNVHPAARMRDHAIEQRCIHFGHIAEQNHRAVRRGWNRANAGPQ